MKNFIIILYDPKTNKITTAKYGEYDVLINVVKPFIVVAMKMKEKFLFFQVEDDEMVFVNNLKDFCGHPISYVNNFKHAKYETKETK
jgi:hypothetical protein